MRLTFIRHCETDLNASGMLHTIKDPIGLNRCGREQATYVVSALQKHNHEIIFSSPEKRAIETAEILAGGLDLNVETIPELRERNWGEWSDKAWDDIKHDLNAMTVDERYAFVPPGGESWEQVEKRGRQALRQITDSRAKDVIIVTHGGTLRILMPVLTGAPLESSFQYDFYNCSITIFNWDGKKFHEVWVNDISHFIDTIHRQ